MKNTMSLLIAAAMSVLSSGLLSASDFEKDMNSIESEVAGYKAGSGARAPAVGEVSLADAVSAGLADKRVNPMELPILTMKDEALAASTPDQKVEMLQTLVRNSIPSEVSNNGLGAQDYRERMIVHILASAGDAASFDRMFYRVGADKLYRSVKDRRPILAMAAKSRTSAVPGDWAGLPKYIETVTGADSPKRNLIKFLIDGPSVMAEGGKALREAKSSIHIEIFQLQADNIGRGLADILVEKAKAGVKVRLLLDVYGSKLDKDPELAKMIASLRAGGVWVITKPLPLLKDHLDHRKVIVIDGKVGFTGGMNVGRLYQIDWHDQQTLIVGPAVTELQKAFVERWYVSGGDLISSVELFPFLSEVPEGAESQVVPHTGQRDQNIKAMYLRAIGTAQKSIRIANPYFTDADMVVALCRAAWRGVKVQLVLPQDNDQEMVQHASRASYPELIKAGVEIYEYKGRMAHEKVAVMDGLWATFGSSNLDARSLENNDELNLAVMDAGVAEDIRTRLFDADLSKCERILHYSPNIADHAADQFGGML
jgi:cardiolipin synthase